LPFLQTGKWEDRRHDFEKGPLESIIKEVSLNLHLEQEIEAAGGALPVGGVRYTNKTPKTLNGSNMYVTCGRYVLKLKEPSVKEATDKS
jgi:hypothetical protein